MWGDKKNKRVLTDISTKVVKTHTIGPGNYDVFYDRQKGFKTTDKEIGFKKHLKYLKKFTIIFRRWNMDFTKEYAYRYYYFQNQLHSV